MRITVCALLTLLLVELNMVVAFTPAASPRWRAFSLALCKKEKVGIMIIDHGSRKEEANQMLLKVNTPVDFLPTTE